MDLTDPRRGSENVLGFTNQTAILLSGIGAKELLPEFKKRNISTEALAELTLEDLQLLGADSKLADRMHSELNAITKRMSRSTTTPQQRLDQLSETLINNNKHLSLIQAFVTYARLRLKKERIDSFIEINNNLRSSKALELAVDATILELQDARSALEELKLFLEDSKPPKNRSVYLAAITGVGLIAFIFLRKLV